MTPKEFRKAYDVKVKGKFHDNTKDADGWEHTAYKVKVTHGDRVVKFKFRMGLAHTDFDKDGALYALASDASAGQHGFVDYCEEYGYDQDSIKAHKTWRACRRMREQADALCTSEDMWQDLQGLEY
jgi:hypothetical protein